MTRSRQRARLLGLAGTLGALAAAPAAHAQLVTLAPVTFSGGLYQYDYTITNNTALDLFDVTIHVAPGLNTVQNLITPGASGDFTPAYDSNTGNVDFLEGNALFTAIPVAGFQFSSPLAPGASTYDATLDDPNNPGATPPVVTSAILAPQAAAVPESGTLALALMAVPGLLLAARRRSATTTSDRLTQGDHTA